MLSALKNWCSKNHTNIVTVSTDNDFKKYCDQEKRFKYFPSLYEFINYVLMDEDNVVAVIHKMLKENEEKYGKKLKAK